VKVVEHDGERIRAVLTNGSTGINASQHSRNSTSSARWVPGMKISMYRLQKREISPSPMHRGPRTNDTSVADHAMALLMAIARGIQVSVR